MRINIDTKFGPKKGSDEYKYFLLLQLHDDFEKLIYRSRDELGLKFTEDGVALHTEIPDPLKSHQAAEKIISELSLHPTLVEQVENILRYGHVFLTKKSLLVLSIEAQLNRSFLSSKQVPTLPMSKMQRDLLLAEDNLVLKGWQRRTRETLSLTGPDPALPVLVMLRRPKSKRQLAAWVSEYWDSIEDAWNLFEMVSPFPPELAEIPLREIEKFVAVGLELKQGLSQTHIAKKLDLEHHTVRKDIEKLNKLFKKIGFPKL